MRMKSLFNCWRIGAHIHVYSLSLACFKTHSHRVAVIRGSKTKGMWGEGWEPRHPKLNNSSDASSNKWECDQSGGRQLPLRSLLVTFYYHQKPNRRRTYLHCWHARIYTPACSTSLNAHAHAHKEIVLLSRNLKPRWWMSFKGAAGDALHVQFLVPSYTYTFLHVVYCIQTVLRLFLFLMERIKVSGLML